MRRELLHDPRQVRDRRRTPPHPWAASPHPPPPQKNADYARTYLTHRGGKLKIVGVKFTVGFLKNAPQFPSPNAVNVTLAPGVV
jgi:hypothetical protein